MSMVVCFRRCGEEDSCPFCQCVVEVELRTRTTRTLRQRSRCASKTWAACSLSSQTLRSTFAGTSGAGQLANGNTVLDLGSVICTPKGGSTALSSWRSICPFVHASRLAHEGRRLCTCSSAVMCSTAPHQHLPPPRMAVNGITGTAAALADQCGRFAAAREPRLDLG